jgi:curved DNA-binding protein
MDYYQILGVSKNADPKQIKQAYKKASMKHHPDRGGNHDEFVKVQQAYETLSNSDKKAAYDNPQPNFNQQSGFEEAMRQANAQYGNNPFAGTPFADMFNFNNRQRTPRNQDVNINASVTISDILTGKSLVARYTLNSGKQETVTLDIPPGAKHGDTIKYQGLGNDGLGHFPRGDLNVKVLLKKQANWERDNDNLITKKTVNVFDLLLGCVIIIHTLDDRKVKLTIPKGTQPGQTFSIPGYGVPNIKNGRRGNLYVVIETKIPNIEEENIIQSISLLRNQLYTKE